MRPKKKSQAFFTGANTGKFPGHPAGLFYLVASARTDGLLTAYCNTSDMMPV
jgi:hypothetical protein